MKNLISVSGKKGSGKNLVAAIITDLNYDQAPWEVKSFADKLKYITCSLIGCTREQLEDREFKEKELGEEWWYVKLDNKLISVQEYIDYIKGTTYSFNEKDIIKLTPRKLLQLLGTECGRNIIHPNLWVLTLMQDYKGDTEIWKPIEDYEDSYKISSFGRVKSLDRKIVYGEDNGQYHTKKSQILKPTLSGGYETVSLSGKTFTVHSLVAKHFVEGYQEGFVVNHIDYNKTNNFYKNLEWITQEDNIKHNKTTLRGNFGERQKDAKLTDEKVVAIKKLLKDGTFSQKQISDLFEVSPTTISNIKKGKKWNHVGKDIPVISPIIPQEYPKWIISDTRFPNEIESVKKHNGLTIRINRDSVLRTGKLFDTDNHESETALDDYQGFDYVIDNNGTIEELKEVVKDILIKEHLI